MDILLMLQAQLSYHDSIDKVYTISLKEFEKLRGRKLNYTYVKKAIVDIANRCYTITEGVPEPKKIYPLKTATYKRGTIELTLNKEIRPHFFHPFM